MSAGVDSHGRHMSNWRSFEWRSYKLSRQMVRLVCRTLYRDENRDLGNSMLVAGAGRSGTTWLADIVASQVPCRLMFEPFEPRRVGAFQGYHYFQYMRPGKQDDRLLRYCRRVLSGDIRHPWIDRHVERIRPQYRLIKEIRANLFLKWIRDRFPEVPILFIVRHPCAVALSRMRLGWWTDEDIRPFLAQHELVEDLLEGRMDVIRGAKTAAQKHAVVWCVSNLVPLKQCSPGDVHVVFYENLCTQPEREIPRVFEAVGQEYSSSVWRRVGLPSMTTTSSSAILRSRDVVQHWKSELSTRQIDEILSVVEGFRLGHIYGDSSTPLIEQLWSRCGTARTSNCN